ncbi:phenylalanine ammonia-lyase [Suillus paluster]|uniref:phenylalanine ammonia-lyase n=1 Tax=Suillus paluster TaxID=48578 RepID=UPI001B867921|nr:phenylalanine ammonia-lyase [Suillus paluster]KAG1739142.1 phenylalanine ammonia-lyase [Suillus paluster]
MATHALVSQYVQDVKELDSYLTGSPIALTGSTLSLSQIAAIALYPPSSPCINPVKLQLTDDQNVKAKASASRAVIESKVAAGISVYGVSTGFGGSADTRTDDPIALGAALLQHQHAGVILPTYAPTAIPTLSSFSNSHLNIFPSPAPLSDPFTSTTMPPTWTRAALLIRANSIMRGHSGVRWELVQKMAELINKGVTPVVPMRGSVSASGDLSSLSYIAATLIGNPAIRAWVPLPRPSSDVPSTSSTPFSTVTSSPHSSPQLSPFSPSTPLLPSADALPIKTPKLDNYESYALLPAPQALQVAGITPLPLSSKEHLGILNGTAFSAAVSALVVRGARGVGVLGAVLTAMSVEAMLGARGSFDPFVGEARPHIGQIHSAHLMYTLLDGSSFASAHEVEVKIEEDAGVLRQDRQVPLCLVTSLNVNPARSYSLRTAPQWLGPQFEDLANAAQVITTEVNSTTDNPLIEPPSASNNQTGQIHHAGNFQALAITNAMDHVRLSLAHIGKLMFVQLTEIVNPAMNRGLLPNLAGGEVGLDFGFKGVDIAAASYTGELNALGGMNVGVGNVSAEMHNQSVNSLALISARYTLTALEVSTLLAASHLLVICQALDLRALGEELREALPGLIRSSLLDAFPSLTDDTTATSLVAACLPTLTETLDHTTTLETNARMHKVAGACVVPLITTLSTSPVQGADLGALPVFIAALATRLVKKLTELRCAYLGVQPNAVRGASPSAEETEVAWRGPAPASKYLAPRTRALYEFVRVILGVRMHGAGNLKGDVFGTRDGLDGEEGTIGNGVSVICEAIRDGRVGRVVVEMLEGIEDL